MHTHLKTLTVLATGLALSASVASAQLLLSGRTTGSFQDLAEANTTIDNAPDGSWATFETGIAMADSTRSRIAFANATFTDVGSGEPIQVGLFDITNGRTEIGSGAPIARFDLGLELTSPTGQEMALTTLNFHVDHTPNMEGAIADTFAITFDQPAPFKIDDTLVQFHVNVDPAEFPLGEEAMVQKGDITVTFTPVPEPATYAAWGAVLLLGAASYRRLRRSRMPAAATN